MADKVRIGLIDCGNISPQYLEWCRIFEIPTHITGVMDFASGAVGTIDRLRRVESQPAVHRDLRL